jgi:hypothetical protein
MTITTARIYYWPRRKRLEEYLTATHWGFAEWFKRRLKPIREQLRGPEAKGVAIVNFMLFEQPGRFHQPNQWRRDLSTFEFAFPCDLSPLRDRAPIENVERLMRFTAAIAAQAPWPQVRAVGAALAEPLSAEDRLSLEPYLTWPRESTLRGFGYAGDRLEVAMEAGRQKVLDCLKEARY